MSAERDEASRARLSGSVALTGPLPRAARLCEESSGSALHPWARPGAASCLVCAFLRLRSPSAEGEDRMAAAPPSQACPEE